MSIKGRNPNSKEKKHMDAVFQIGCIVCLNKGFPNHAVEIHHVHGKTKLDAHFSVLPLCFDHHRGGDHVEPVISRHPWKKRFEKAYGTEQELLDQVNGIVKNTYKQEYKGNFYDHETKKLYKWNDLMELRSDKS